MDKRLHHGWPILEERAKIEEQELELENAIGQ
jgi:hypothetical protein